MSSLHETHTPLLHVQVLVATSCRLLTLHATRSALTVKRCSSSSRNKMIAMTELSCKQIICAYTTAYLQLDHPSKLCLFISSTAVLHSNVHTISFSKQDPTNMVHIQARPEDKLLKWTKRATLLLSKSESDCAGAEAHSCA